VRSKKHLSEFEKRLKKGPLMIVMVYADWCGACHTMMPHFDAAAKSPSRSIQAVKVNEQMLQAVNKSINEKVNKSAKPLNVEGYPSIIVVDNKGNAVTEIEPVRNTESMTALMAQAGPLAETAGINKTNENPNSVVNTAVKNSIKNIASNVNNSSENDNSINVNNASNAMAMTTNNASNAMSMTTNVASMTVKNKKLLTNLGIENQGLVAGPPKGNNMNLNSRNADVGEDELLGSIASKNNKNKSIKLASIAPNKLANAGLNNEKSVKESLKEATAPSPLNTFGSVKNESKGPAISANIKKEAEAVTSLAAPLMPPSVGSDMEESESISNKLTAEQKVSGGGYNRKDGGSLYSAMARTTYLLAPAAGLLATAAMVMKGKKRGNKTSKASKKNRKTLRRRR
jgi:thiol-disulfide isomerase/thioredoxin